MLAKPKKKFADRRNLAEKHLQSIYREGIKSDLKMTSVTRTGQTFSPSPTGVTQERSDPSLWPRRGLTSGRRARAAPARPAAGPSRPCPAEAPGEARGYQEEAKGAGPAPAAPRAADATAETTTAAAASASSRRAEGKGREERADPHPGAPRSLTRSLTDHGGGVDPARGEGRGVRARARAGRARRSSAAPVAALGGSRDCGRVGPALNAHAPRWRRWRRALGSLGSVVPGQLTSAHALLTLSPHVSATHR